MSNQYLSFDVTKQSAPQQLITGRQGDSQLKFVTMLFWDGDKNVPYDLTGKQVAFEALKPDNTHIVDYEGITILDAPAGLVRYSFNEQVFSVAGTMQQAFFKITHTDSGNNVIADSTLEVAINILENRVEFGINSTDYLSEYDDLIAKVEKKFDDYAAAVQDSIDKSQALHEQIVEYTNLINNNGVIKKTEFGDITQLKQPEGNTVVDKFNNELSQRGVNVKWFGAKGDGVTDDTLSIQSAIDTGLSVFIPSGKYNVKELKGFASGQIIQGISKVESWGGQNTQNITILNGIGSADNYVIKNNVLGNGILPTAITVKNLTIEGSKQTNGILVGNSSTIEGVKIQDCINGLSNIKVSNVMNCQINGCTNGVMNATDSKITNNFFYKNEVGINFDNSNDNSIVNNKIEWNGIGISLTNAVFNLISNNIIDRNTTYGIYTSHTTNTTITGNQFERNLTNHLYLYGSLFNISANSFFRKNSEDDQSGTVVPDVAIFTKSVSNSTITNNLVDGKMFNNTGTDYSSNVNFFGNTINGINPDSISISVPETTVVHAQDTKIIIPLPTYFDGILSNPYNVEIVSQKIAFTAQNGNFYSIGGIIKSIYMSTSGIELTIFNGLNDDLKIKGTIKLRCVYPNLY